MLRSLPIGLALLRAVDAIEAKAFSPAVGQDFDGVAVEGGDDGAGKSAAQTVDGMRNAANSRESLMCPTLAVQSG